MGSIPFTDDFPHLQMCFTSPLNINPNRKAFKLELKLKPLFLDSFHETNIVLIMMGVTAVSLVYIFLIITWGCKSFFPNCLLFFVVVTGSTYFLDCHHLCQPVCLSD